MISFRSTDQPVREFSFDDPNKKFVDVASGSDRSNSSPRLPRMEHGMIGGMSPIQRMREDAAKARLGSPRQSDEAKAAQEREAVAHTFDKTIATLSATGSSPHPRYASPVSSERASPLCLNNLVALPPEVSDALTSASLNSEFSSPYFFSVFEIFNEKTEDLEPLWKTIAPSENRSSDVRQTSEEAAADAIVLPRFSDTHLIDNNAIKDPVRSDRYGKTHFLHANRLDFSESQRFIASQKPQEAEIPGFWKMLHQKKVRVIVDLTNARDNENDPSDYSFGQRRNEGAVKCGALTIKLPGKNIPAKMLNAIRGGVAKRVASEKTFSVSQDGTSHDVTRIHFKDWPDHGVTSAEKLIALADQVEAANEGSDAPVLIHCRAGVGRTGTLISFLAARKRIAKELEQTDGPVTVAMICRILLEVTAEGRLVRGPYFVQKGEQFHLAASALARYFSTIQPGMKRPPSPDPNTGRRQGRAVRKMLQSIEEEKQDQAVEDNTTPTPRAQKNVRFDSNPQVHLMSARFDSNAGSDASHTSTTPEPSPVNAHAKATPNYPIRATFAQPATDINAPPRNVRSSSNAPGTPEIVRPDDEDVPDLIDLRNRVSPQVAHLWKALARPVNEPVSYLDSTLIEQEVTGLPCVEATAVSVMLNGTKRYVHANHVQISQYPSEVASQQEAHRYIAGQSPKHFDSCEKILLNAIESREGIFQLVSPTTHSFLQRDRINDIDTLFVAPILIQLLAKHAQGEEIIIGNQYRIVPVKRDNTPDHIASYDLTVTSLNDSGEEFSIPLTQIGLKFDNAVLEEDEIRAANAALDQHLQHNPASSSHPASEPIILSRKGVGRNATLIAYHEILPWIRSGQIVNEADLDNALQNVIAAGRRARGTRFVHSPQQLQELRNALLADMAEQVNG